MVFSIICFWAPRPVPARFCLILRSSVLCEKAECTCNAMSVLVSCEHLGHVIQKSNIPCHQRHWLCIADLSISEVSIRDHHSQWISNSAKEPCGCCCSPRSHLHPQRQVGTSHPFTIICTAGEFGLPTAAVITCSHAINFFCSMILHSISMPRAILSGNCWVAPLLDAGATGC